MSLWYCELKMATQSCMTLFKKFTKLILNVLLKTFYEFWANSKLNFWFIWSWPAQGYLNVKLSIFFFLTKQSNFMPFVTLTYLQSKIKLWSTVHILTISILRSSLSAFLYFLLCYFLNLDCVCWNLVFS